MAQDQQQLMKVFGSLLAAKGGQEEEGPDPQAEYYRQREKYEKRRMLSSIVAPIAGQFLGNLVAAPFREPVQDFLRTQEGRELYGQWREHDLERQTVDALTGDIEKYEGNALEYFTDKNYKRMSDELVNIAGPDWKNSPELRGTLGEYLTKSEELALEEHAQYMRARDYYSTFPTQQEFLDNVERYGPKSTNLGQAFFRKVKRLFRGQSYDDFVKESIGNIVGVDYDIFEQDLRERPSNETSRKWRMDTRSLQEILSEATEVVTPSKMYELLDEAQAKYATTAAYAMGELDILNQRITEAELGNMTAQYVNYVNGEETTMSDLMYKAIRDLGGFGTGSNIKSPSQVYNKMYEMIEITPENFKQDDLVEWMKSTEAGHALLWGKVTEEDIKNEAGEVVIPSGTKMPGVLESVFLRMNQLSPTRRETINWAVEDESGEFVGGSGIQALTDTESRAYYAAVDDMLSNIINTSRDVAAVIIGKQHDAGMLPDGLENPELTRVYQLGLINEGLQYVSDYFLERRPMEISERTLRPLWNGVDRSTVDNVLSGVILPLDQIIEQMGIFADEVENKIEQNTADSDVLTSLTADPNAVVLPPPGTVDPPTRYSDDLDLTNIDSWRNFTRNQRQIFSDTFTELDDATDPYNRAKIVGGLSNSVYYTWRGNNPDASFIDQTKALDSVKSASSNLIPNTKAFNFAGMPLTEVVNFWYDGIDQASNPELQQALDDISEAFDLQDGGFEEGHPFITTPDGEQLYVRLYPQRALWTDPVHRRVQNATGSSYLTIQVGRRVEPTEADTADYSEDSFRALGSNSSDRDISPAPLPEKVFEEIESASEAKILLRENWRELPDYLQQHIAVQFSQGYLPLLKELSGAPYNLSGKELLNKVAANYMTQEGEYPGTHLEKTENEIRFAMDVSIKSLGVPGRDKVAGDKWGILSGGVPVMHAVGLEAYSELIGAKNQEEIDFLNELRFNTGKEINFISSAEASEVAPQEQESLLSEEVEQAPIISERPVEEEESLLGRQMSLYDKIWEISSEFEGTDYVENVGTLDESNNSGLTLKTYKAIQIAKGEEEPTANDLKALSTNQVKEIIREEFYDKPGLDKLPDDLQGVVFDHGLMRGSSNAIKLLQRTLGLRGDQVDGLLGEQTLDVLSGAYLPQIINSYQGARVQELEDLIEANPEDLEQFRTGWIRRARTYGK